MGTLKKYSTAWYINEWFKKHPGIMNQIKYVEEHPSNKPVTKEMLEDYINKLFEERRNDTRRDEQKE